MKRLLIFIVFLVVLVAWFVMSTVGEESILIQPGIATQESVMDTISLKDSVKLSDSTASLYDN